MIPKMDRITVFLILLTYATNILSAANPSSCADASTIAAAHSWRPRKSCERCFTYMRRELWDPKDTYMAYYGFPIDQTDINLPDRFASLPDEIKNELRSLLASGINHNISTGDNNDEIQDNGEYENALEALSEDRGLHKARTPFDILAALERGDDPNELDEHGNTPLLANLALEHNTTPPDADEVMRGTYHKSRADKIRLLLLHGADPKIRNTATNVSPLEKACFYHRAYPEIQTI